jgi:hypothetical protein
MDQVLVVNVAASAAYAGDLPTGLPRGVHGPAAQGFDVGQSGTE